MLKLIEPNKKYIDEYRIAYQESIKKINEGKIKKHSLMFMNPDETDIIKKYMDNKDEDKLPKEYVPSYDYFMVDNGKFIGIIHIRIRLTEKLLNYGGHIGYGVNPIYWNKGYGTKILELGLKKAKELINDDKVLITCDDDNIGSWKIIEKNGGVLENKVQNKDAGEEFITRRYWINL